MAYRTRCNSWNSSRRTAGESRPGCNTGDKHRTGRRKPSWTSCPMIPRFTYDIHEVIDKIVDGGEFLELKEDFANHLVIGLARCGGFPVGLVANNPDEMSGILEPDSSDKYPTVS